MRPGYFSLSACSSISFSNRLQFSYDLVDPVGAEMNRHSSLADIDFVKEISAEEHRGVAEQFSEQELALFNVLAKSEKKTSWSWTGERNSEPAADVYTTVKTVLDELPRAYTPERYQQKCDTVYQHVYDSYQGEGLSIYATACR